MSAETDTLTFATQGGEFSYHAMAARRAAHSDINIEDYERFGEVIQASGNFHPGLGVIAIRTVAGVVEESAGNLVSHRPDMLTPIVGRVDLDIDLAIIGSHAQSLEDLNRRGVRCFMQKAAREQCTEFLTQRLPWIKPEGIGESTRGIKAALERNSPDWVAIGPTYAAEPMGGVIIGPERINPEGSVSSFYVLQRNPNDEILPEEPEKTAEETILSIVYPNEPGEFEKCIIQAREYGIPISRFIPFDIGKYRRRKHGKLPTEFGGIFEVALAYYHPDLRQWIGHVNNLKDNHGNIEKFSIYRLGSYPWYENHVIDLSDSDQSVDPLMETSA